MSFDYWSKRRMQYFLEKIKDKLDLKINTSDIIDNLNTQDSTKALSANQGYVLENTKQDNIWTGTQAEYEAQASQIPNGTIVQITDDEKSITFIEGQIIYSLEERQVGCWCDGKPLYQKTIELNTFSFDNSWKTVYTDSTIENVINVSLTNGESLMYGRVNYQFYQNNLQCTSTTNFTLTNPKFTIQYTKIADTPGSGTWTPNGNYAHHYSESEQIIGTWIDGSTIYRKIITGLSITLSQNAWTTLPNIIIENGKDLIDAKCYGTYTEQYLINCSKVHLNKADGTIEIRCVDSDTTLTAICLEYTKLS